MVVLLQVTKRMNWHSDNYYEVESFRRLFPAEDACVFRRCFQRQQWLGKARLRRWVSDVVLVKGSVALIERRLWIFFFSLCWRYIYKNMRGNFAVETDLSAYCVPLMVKQIAHAQLCDPLLEVINSYPIQTWRHDPSACKLATSQNETHLKCS